MKIYEPIHESEFGDDWNSLLDKNQSPNEKQVIDSIGGVLCRCTCYTKIIQANLNTIQIHKKNLTIY